MNRPLALTYASAWSLRYGPWAVVTGASDGIGEQIAHELAARGVHLVLVARRRSKLEALAAALERDHAIAVRVIDADLATPAGVDAVITGTRDLAVGLYVASAGFGTSGPFLDNPIEHELAMIDVNCRALAALAHAFGARLAQRGRGGMVLLSSLVAFQGVPHAANYAATKAFVQTLAEGLHLELAKAGVDVLAAAPGPVHSGFAARAGMQMGRALTPVDVARATLDALGSRTTVRPGWLSVLLEGSLAPLPRALRSRILAQVMQGMTRHRTTPALP